MTMIHIAVGLLFEEESPEILESTFYEDERGPLHLSMDPTRFSTPQNYEEVQHEIRLVLGVEKTALRRGGLNLHKEFRRLEESGWHAFAHLRSIALLSDIEQPHSTLHIFEWVRYDLYPHAMHRGIRPIPSWKGICKPEAWKFLRDEVLSGVQEREVTAAPFQPLRLLPKGEIPDFSGALEAFAVDFDIKIVRPQKPMPFFLTPGVEIVRYLGTSPPASPASPSASRTLQPRPRCARSASPKGSKCLTSPFGSVRTSTTKTAFRSWATGF